MKTSPLKQLGTLGQSIWLDYIRKDLNIMEHGTSLEGVVFFTK